ncbi:hypothetical protein DPMN_049781 [Dreissena polymorpha]|uniref:Uncharacterized protein n=1 Tax=Dreissena polymorpha TaxID=45954 RepID=A0A9D4CG75_DREPO|nr:hypothetical protein DPMN_049781 [Dreissena polymorpha]
MQLPHLRRAVSKLPVTGLRHSMRSYQKWMFTSFKSGWRRIDKPFHIAPKIVELSRVRRTVTL